MSLPQFRALIALFVFSGFPLTSAYWRMSCGSRLLDERVDPIIAPGQISAHVHTVSGANGFGFTMDYNQARAATCSTCEIEQDFSNYWTPKLYYQAQNGSFTMVPQVGDGNGQLGGMTVYYLQRPGPNNDKLKAFPAGFRMITGDPFKRNFTGDSAAQAVSFVCLNYASGSSQSNSLPNTACPDGLRAQVFFPSCWNGVDLDSPDHQSHMSYPIGAYDSGSCPKSHPVHLISIFYEIIYDTSNFPFYGSSQPFVFAMGDPTGYGFHGDFVNGWNVPVLQKAVTNCNDSAGVVGNCPYFTQYTGDQMNACKTPVVLGSDIQGPLTTLPGCNPVSPGPAEVIPPTTCNANPKIIPVNNEIADLTSQGWKYIGCGVDTSTRALSGSSYFDNDMTLEKCTSYCKQKGYAYAGAEYSTQCFCGATLPSASAQIPGSYGNCRMPCGGNANQVCGGPNYLTLYQTCKGSACKNFQLQLVGGKPTQPNERRSLDSDLDGARRHAKDFAVV